MLLLLSLNALPSILMLYVYIRISSKCIKKLGEKLCYDMPKDIMRTYNCRPV